MTDKELLELAAKAAGMVDWRWHPKSLTLCLYNKQMGTWYQDSYGYRVEWAPLKDDGDALRLAVKLGLAVIPYPIYSEPKHSVIVKKYDRKNYFRGQSPDFYADEIQVYGDDQQGATRRAIVLSAANIGKEMP
jgi:hypothetical protein